MSWSDLINTPNYNDNGPLYSGLGYHLVMLILGALDGKKERQKEREEEANQAINLRSQAIDSLRDTNDWINNHLIGQVNLIRGEYVNLSEATDYEIEQRDKRIEELEAKLKELEGDGVGE